MNQLLDVLEVTCPQQKTHRITLRHIINKGHECWLVSMGGWVSERKASLDSAEARFKEVADHTVDGYGGRCRYRHY